MIEKDKTFVVMGLLDPDSLAWHIGQTLREMGGRVVYTIQNEILKKLFLDESAKLTPAERAAIEYRYCDVTDEDQIAAVFRDLGPVAGLVHSLAFANPRLLLGETPHTTHVKEIAKSFQISCASLVSAVRCALPNFKAAGGGAVVAMTFDSQAAYPHYNWMSANKAALEAMVRVLARCHGKDGLRVNAVSAGPLRTLAASRIPSFGDLIELFDKSCPVGWDPDTGRRDVAYATAFLLGPYARRITGQVLFVDGGCSAMRGELQPFERPA